VKLLILDNGSNHLTELVRLTNGYITDVKKPQHLKLSDLDSYSGVILSGGHDHPVKGNDDYFKQELELIHRSHLPILGVCLGFELLAYAGGAMLFQLPSAERGTLTVYPTPEGSYWLGDQPIEVFESHRWGLSVEPVGFVALARSDMGIEAIANFSRRQIGFQFHPEHVVDKHASTRVFSRALTRLLEL
jgi:GMP synthase-like glutamine amidotransferase